MWAKNEIFSHIRVERHASNEFWGDLRNEIYVIYFSRDKDFWLLNIWHVAGAKFRAGSRFAVGKSKGGGNSSGRQVRFNPCCPCQDIAILPPSRSFALFDITFAILFVNKLSDIAPT